jgi:hypothetical protein
LFLASVFHLIVAFTALKQGAFFVTPPEHAFLSVNTWGWLHLLLGILVGVTAVLYYLGRRWAQVITIPVALVSAVANFLFIPYYPFWAVLIIMLDVLLIWAVAVHGEELRALIF